VCLLVSQSILAWICAASTTSFWCSITVLGQFAPTLGTSILTLSPPPPWLQDWHHTGIDEARIGRKLRRKLTTKSGREYPCSGLLMSWKIWPENSTIFIMVISHCVGHIHSLHHQHSNHNHNNVYHPKFNTQFTIRMLWWLASRLPYYNSGAKVLDSRRRRQHVNKVYL
jgi:hypothetical protein